MAESPRPDAATETFLKSTDETIASPPPASQTAGSDGGEVGAVIGKYRIERKLGEGGMAAVYLAVDDESGQKVALKMPFVVPSEMTTTVKRLQREAQAANSIHHPHVCQVYEVGEHNGRIFLAMQFIEGMSLAEWLQKTPELTTEKIVDIVAKIAHGVHAAHEAGILHRDLKTGNVMITASSGEPIVTDFGMARWTEVQLTVLTPSGAMVGTPGYMAPEQIMGDAAAMSPASDVYSLGVILYELLTGWLPFTGNLATLLGSIVSDPPPPLATHVPGIDPRLEAICLKAMAKAPGDRYRTAAEFAQALEQYPSAPLPGVEAPPGESATETSPGGLRGLFRGLFPRKG